MYAISYYDYDYYCITIIIFVLFLFVNDIIFVANKKQLGTKKKKQKLNTIYK